jgi:hypothetical protein
MNKACVKLSHYLILKYYYKDIVIKTTWLHKVWDIDQQNRIENT